MTGPPKPAKKPNETMILTIAPNFDPARSRFYFTSQELNELQRAEYADTFGFWQSNYNLYSYMRMNQFRKYILHVPKAHPFAWQPYKSCSVSETGSLTMGQRELEPERIAMHEKFCHDELFDSAYEQMIQYSEGGNVELNGEGVTMFNALVDEILANAALGFRLTGAVGGLYDLSSVAFDADTPATLRDLFTRTHDSFQGWVKLAFDLASTGEAPWLNTPTFDDTQFDSTNTYTGNVVDLFEDLKANAPRPLRQLINRGGMLSRNGQNFMPLIVVSDAFYNAVVRYYNDESEKVATNRMRIVKQVVDNPNPGTPRFVYWLDDQLPIIPLSDLNGFDLYLAGDTHFAGIVASGNIQIGASFAQLPQDIENRDIGVLIARNDDPTRSDYGKYSVRSFGLAKTAIADVDYMVSSIRYTEPA